MRSVVALACSTVLACLTGCVADATDAVAAAPVAASPALETTIPTLVGYEIHRLFQEEKGRATESELPAQF